MFVNIFIMEIKCAFIITIIIIIIIIIIIGYGFTSNECQKWLKLFKLILKHNNTKPITFPHSNEAKPNPL